MGDIGQRNKKWMAFGIRREYTVIQVKGIG